MLSSILSFALVWTSFFFMIRPAIGHFPDEIISNFLPIAAKQTPVDGTAEIKRWPKTSWPVLQVTNLRPRQTLPGRNVLRQYVSVEHDQVDHEEGEQNSQPHTYVAKHLIDVFNDES